MPGERDVGVCPSPHLDSQLGSAEFPANLPRTLGGLSTDGYVQRDVQAGICSALDGHSCVTHEWGLSDQPGPRPVQDLYRQ